MYCRCKCQCGNDAVVMASKLKSGHTKSCGCLQKERAAEAIRTATSTHHMSNTKAYSIWLSLKRRCDLVTDKAYRYYGGRGISVCDEWYNSFENFYDWMIMNGYIECSDMRNTAYTIDRIDVNGDYAPDNCRLTTMLTQANNKRNNRIETYNGESHTVAEWARVKGIKYKTLCNRLYRGWSFDRAINT